jgi:RsiW-degrading membrane proteinase PrsW (M82 family)
MGLGGNKMEMEAVYGIGILWTVLSAMIFLMYTVQREDKKAASWSEIILVALCLPGVILSVAAGILAVLLGVTWDLFDKPIRKSRNGEED